MIRAIVITAALCGLSAGAAFGLAFVHEVMDTPPKRASVPQPVLQESPRVVRNTTASEGIRSDALRSETGFGQLAAPTREPQPFVEIPAPVIVTAPHVLQSDPKPTRSATQSAPERLFAPAGSRPFATSDFPDQGDVDQRNRLARNWYIGVFR